ncbi:hypothetical protein Peur_055324 [Populus x canadensis]
MACLVARSGRELQRYDNLGRRQVVGCIPYRFKNCSDGSVGDELEVLVITSQKGQARGMMFPKGGWELDESVEEAASRESLEEAGVLGNVEDGLGKWNFLSKRHGTFYEGYMFPLLVTKQLDLWPEKNVRQRIWTAFVWKNIQVDSVPYPLFDALSFSTLNRKWVRIQPAPERRNLQHCHCFSKTQDLDFIFEEVEVLDSSKPTNQKNQLPSKTNEPSDDSHPSERMESTVQISHPWPEWVDLMELLLKRGYFEAGGNPVGNKELGSKDASCIRTACLNFARDRFGLIRYFSRKDIGVIAGCGCPSIDRKVVNSGKRLRAHVGINEGHVCSSCNLRGDCERAYVKAREDEGGRTVDVMRILLTYGLDYVSGTVENKPCQKNKMVKESVRRLLKELVGLSNDELVSDLPNGKPLKRGLPLPNNSTTQDKGPINVPMKPGDWLCPECNFLNFARNVRCLRCDGLHHERLKHLCEDQDHLPLKKGDWICAICNFLNFAKNTRCLQCKEKPPKRHLNPGEWECESCNYINFRRNMVCLKCDHRRPKASNCLKSSTELEHGKGGNPEQSRLKFLHSGNEAADHKFVGVHGTHHNRGADVWRFVEEEREDNHSISSNEGVRFVDFPIAGGKSSLSQNAQKRERWKLEMLERSKGGVHVEEDEKEFEYANTQRRFKYLESTDDEDMAEWFGHGGKKETRCSGTESEKILD